MGATLPGPSLKPSPEESVFLCRIWAPIESYGVTFDIEASGVAKLPSVPIPTSAGILIPIQPLYGADGNENERDVVVTIASRLGSRQLRPMRFYIGGNEILGILVVNGSVFFGLPYETSTQEEEPISVALEATAEIPA